LGYTFRLVIVAISGLFGRQIMSKCATGFATNHRRKHPTYQNRKFPRYDARISRTV